MSNGSVSMYHNSVAAICCPSRFKRLLYKPVRNARLNSVVILYDFASFKMGNDFANVKGPTVQQIPKLR